VRVHTGEKPFKCEPCGQAFADRSNFVKHKQTKTHKNRLDPTQPAPTNVRKNKVAPARTGGANIGAALLLPSPKPVDPFGPVPQSSHLPFLQGGLENRGIRSSLALTSFARSFSQNEINYLESTQFGLIDSPNITLNQHDLDSHVPISDAEDTLPLSFEDIDDVCLTNTEFYMAQVDGESDLVDTTKTKPAPLLSQQPLVNGVYGVAGVSRDWTLVTQQSTVTTQTPIKVEPVTHPHMMNGMPGSETSILARHLAMSPADPGYSPVKNLGPVKKIVPVGVNAERIYSCDMCSAKLKNKRNFETHMKRHRGELPFKCDECPKTFQGRRDLETHKRSRHDPAKKPKSELQDLDLDLPKLEMPKTPSSLDNVTSGPIFSAANFGNTNTKTIVLSMNGLPAGLMHAVLEKSETKQENNILNFLTYSENMNTVLIKQDPVMVTNHKDEPPDPEDFILQDSLPLFDSSLMEAHDGSVNLSLDDLTNFAQPLHGGLPGSAHDQSFDTSMDGSSSFLSSADTFDLVGDNTSDCNRTPSLADIRSESGGMTSPFTPRSGSGTPSLPDEGEFPCPQCDKRFGNRRNLMSHMRRHTGDYKLFCENCGKGFFTQSKLDSHKRKHTGEKPFRCLLSSCLKRFRYKGDLSKHIKRYHPGHTQQLTPVPLQDDEIAALQNAHQAAKQKSIPITVTSTGKVIATNHQDIDMNNGNHIVHHPPAQSSTLRAVLTTGLRPNQLLLQQQQQPPRQMQQQPPRQMQPPTAFTVTSVGGMPRISVAPTNPGTIIPDSDPSLDENLLNMLAADGSEEDDDPMLSPTINAKTLAGLTAQTSGNNAALVFPNAVFSSKPASSQEAGVFLQSSGKAGFSKTLHEEHNGKDKINHVIQSQPHFIQPQGNVTFNSTIKNSPKCSQVGLLPATSQATSSQTLRALLSSTPENLPVSQTMKLTSSPLSLSSSIPQSVLTTTFSLSRGPTNCYLTSPSRSPGHRMSESFLPADISFTSESSRESLNDTVTLTLDDILTYAQVPIQPKSEIVKSDRDDDMTSPGSVNGNEVREMNHNNTKQEMDDFGDKFRCQFPNCGRSFDRANLLKRHIRLHSGECRFVCDVCKKCFESGSKLDDHYRRHTGERPFQCHVCGNKFRYKGDRTKHLKNLHGIHKSVEGTNNSSDTIPVNSFHSDKTPFMPSIAEETNSSISSFHSNAEMSDAASLSGSMVGESPTKFDPLELPTASIGAANGLHCGGPPPETVTMSLDEVIQYAQPIADFSF